jgi:hypothetical protein
MTPTTKTRKHSRPTIPLPKTTPPTAQPPATPTRIRQSSILSYLTTNSKPSTIQGCTASPDANNSNSNWVHDTTHFDEEDPILSPFGHDASIVDSSNKDPFRVYFQNIRGFKFQAGDAFLTEAVGFLASFNTPVACLAETNTDWRHDEAQNRVRDQFRMCCNATRVATSNSGVNQESLYQPGGTTTAVMGKWSGR